MPEPVTIPEETLQQVAALGSVEYVCAVASHDQAETIGPVMKTAWAGLEQAFPRAKKVIVHVDAGSRDGTAERALAALPSGSLVQVRAAADPAARLAASVLAYRADALRVIFALAQRLEARGCVVVDPDVTSIAPDWIGRLLAPIEAGRADFVAPYYVRHRFAGPLTTGVVYPWLRALYGRRVRYPGSGEFACSAALIRRYAAGSGQSEIARLSVDVELTTQALAGGVPLAQAFLGVKTQASSDATGDVGATLNRVLGALFLAAERTAPVWQKIRGSQAVPLEGSADAATPQAATVDRERALAAFRLGERNLHEIWAPVLPPLALLELRKVARLPDGEFRFPDALWARIAYDFALAYRIRVMNRDHLLSAFTPIFYGWLASFVGEVQTAPDPNVEARIERLCLQFEAEKPYLISRWRWPDRFSP
jgi:hypothetical protein